MFHSNTPLPRCDISKSLGLHQSIPTQHHAISIVNTQFPTAVLLDFFSHLVHSSLLCYPQMLSYSTTVFELLQNQTIFPAMFSQTLSLLLRYIVFSRSLALEPNIDPDYVSSKCPALYCDISHPLSTWLQRCSTQVNAVKAMFTQITFRVELEQNTIAFLLCLPQVSSLQLRYF